MTKNEWFEDWFNSPFYHILYKDRDYQEAGKFIHNLTEYLALKNDAKVLDLGCGKGRHSLELKKHYGSVLGIDLSINSINEAKKHETKGLKFQIGDMRFFNSNLNFDAVFNLFTSFGYFNDIKDNLKVLSSCKDALTKNGFLILDYLNAEKIKLKKQNNEIKVVDQIEFHIERKIENEKILKKIEFKHDNKSYNFEEKVQLFTLKDFINIFEKSGFLLEKAFGSYKLEPFEKENSDRLILIAKNK